MLKKPKTLASLLLAVMMTVSFAVAIPLFASAAEDEIITGCSATVTAPVERMFQDRSIESGDGEKYTVSLNYWLHGEGGYGLGENERFAAGQTYIAYITLKANPGYDFVYPDKGNLPVVVNGVAAEVISWNTLSRAIYCHAEFVAEESKLLASGSATVTAPIDGLYQDRTVISGDEDKYTAYFNYWLHGENFYGMQEDERFVGGQTYIASVTLVAKDGYDWEYPVGTWDGSTYDFPVTINGIKARIGGFNTFSHDIYCSVEFTAVESEILASGSATVTAPIDGFYQDRTVISGDEEKYTAYFNYWLHGENFYGMQEDEKFVLGKTYIASVTLVAKPGYNWDYPVGTWDGSTYDFPVTINGIKARIGGFNTFSRDIYCSVEFTATAEMLASGSATVTAPVDGMFQDKTVVSGDDEKYTAYFHFWSHGGTGYGMQEDEKFVVGQTYNVYVTLTAKPGYNWEYPDSGSWDGSSYAFDATINGNKARVYGFNSFSRDIMCAYTFTATAEMLSSGSATVIAPVHGMFQDKMVISGDDEKYTAFFHFWSHGGTGYGMQEDEKFIAGQTYNAYVTLTAKPGYNWEYPDSGSWDGSSYAFDVTINGNKARVYGFNSFSRDIMCAYTFTAEECGHDCTAVVTAPTCTEEGYTTYTCLLCGDVFYDDFVPALGHEYVLTVIDYGLYNVCARCGETELAGFDYVKATASVVKLNGSKNELTITVTGYYGGTAYELVTEKVLIDNNSAGTYAAGPFKVFVDTKGNTQVRDIFIIE